MVGAERKVPEVGKLKSWVFYAGTALKLYLTT